METKLNDQYEEMCKRLEDNALKYCQDNDLDTKEWKFVHIISKFSVETKAEGDETKGVPISGFASTFKNIDRVGDVIAGNSFDSTLKEIKKLGGKLPMLKDHWNSVDYQAGSWHKFKVLPEEGLFVNGRISETKNTEHMLQLIIDGHLDTLSIGGIFRYAERKDPKSPYIIEEIRLFEISIVSVPANPKARFTQKSLSGGTKNTSSDDRLDTLGKFFDDSVDKEIQEAANMILTEINRNQGGK